MGIQKSTGCWCLWCLCTYCSRLRVIPLWTRTAYWFCRFQVLFMPEQEGICHCIPVSRFLCLDDEQVAMPLFAMVEFNHTVRAVAADARPVLLSFRGTRSPRSDQTRKHLWKLHNGKDIIVPCACRWFDAEKPDAQGYDERCAQDETEFQKQTYTHLMATSKFSLIVEGFGYHSFRLTEVLAAGAIPVIAIDHYVLPYAMLLDWDSFSIRVPEHQLMQLPDILRAIPAARVDRMQQRAAEVYELFFASLSLQVATAVEEIRLVHFVPAQRQTAERRRLLTHGLDYAEAVSQPTPSAVQHASMYCNAPAHRRKNAKDGAVMR
eukprot:m.593869 g.593869  ORF g.593869 m.593869 type:complete len:321 (+) comp22397_c0_seq3:204-1166(+)